MHTKVYSAFIKMVSEFKKLYFWLLKICSISLTVKVKITVFLYLRRVPFSGMVRRVALVRTDVAEESIASIIRATRIGEVEQR
jgi:hypothetical protein